MKMIDNNMMDALSEEAHKSPRLRKNFNFHESHNEPSQRLLNAMEPGSYIRPHRHLTDPKPEAFLVIRGHVALVVFEDDGRVESVVQLRAGSGVVGAEIPVGAWHTVVSLESGSIFYETKPGPFNPIHKNDMAPWAPEEGSDAAREYLERVIEEYREYKPDI